MKFKDYITEKKSGLEKLYELAIKNPYTTYKISRVEAKEIYNQTKIDDSNMKFYVFQLYMVGMKQKQNTYIPLEWSASKSFSQYEEETRKKLEDENLGKLIYVAAIKPNLIRKFV